VTRRSFRTRIVAGSVLWALGLIFVVSIGAAATAHHFPKMIGVIHVIAMTTGALVLMFIGVMQVRRGLLPFNELRTHLGAVREGKTPRVGGEYPEEVQPLVDDLNALLDHRDTMIARAQAKAGDLAHGLKTPLAVLAQEAERAGAQGHTDLSSTLRHEVDRMRRQIDYHLAQARAAASGSTLGARCAVRASADGLVRTLQRLHADKQLTIDVHVAADHAVRSQREDLDEMLGNLLDNACKWARTHVVLTSAVSGLNVELTVDDDGPGLDVAIRAAVLQRGVRADETAPGSGLGLAIVRELAALYRGTIALEPSPTGGVRARLTLPAA
jgi:signal transduction histidine kinase